MHRPAAVAFAGFGLDLALHLLTFTPLDLSRAVPLAFIPVVAMFPVFGAAVLHASGGLRRDAVPSESFIERIVGLP